MTFYNLSCLLCERRFRSLEALNHHTRDTHENPNWTPSKHLPHQKPPPICPTCGEPAKITATQYGPRASCCGLHSWGLKPLVDLETHRARNAAHAAFDPLWQSRVVSRDEAYRRLQAAMGLSAPECHIAQMTVEQAARVVEIAQAGLLLEMA